MLERTISLRSLRVAVLLVAALAVVPAPAAAPAFDGVTGWINRMNLAVTRRTFEGVLVRQIGKTREKMKIIHRVQGRLMNERLIIIPTVGAGPGNEFVRNGNDSIAYYPKQGTEEGTVIVQERNRSYGFLRAFNGVNGSARNYVLTDHGTATIDGRVVQHVSLEPRDALRYGYHFWIDTDSALPLKTQILAPGGEVLEDIWFETFSLPATIADERFKPEFDVSKFKWKVRKMPAYNAELKKKFVPREELLPAGFQVTLMLSTEREAAEQAKAGGPRARYLITDGIAVVSVFIELADQGPESRPVPKDAKGKSAAVGDISMVMGSTTVYGKVVDGHKITVVGEVPLATAKAIAAALKSE